MSDAASTPTQPAAASGERRQVTVLFADMVGFTAISEQLGEEGTFALIQPIYELMACAVKEQGGSVKDFTGDGIMALFGAPEALEDAPLRACRAALLIHERLAAAAPEIEAKNGVRPQMRIGVNSGLAVVTQIRGENTSTTALGDTVNLASRLQTLAEPGTAALSEATERLVRGLVETTFAGEHAIKGKAEPQKVWRLDSLRQGATRFDAARGRGLSAYVGRERELEILERSFVESRRELRVIDVVAEPGMGKSRLLHEFRLRVGKELAFILSGSCSPDGRQTPFLPFIEVVRGSFQVHAGELEAEIARKLGIGLNVLGLSSPETLGLLLNLLGLKPSEGSLDGLDGVLIGLRTRDLLQNLLAARCRLSPVVLLIEDLHWIDGASQEVLGKIVESYARLGMLILHTRRPEYEPAWRDKAAVMSLKLEPLAVGDVRRLIQTRLAVDALPEALTRQVTEKAEGNALFAEEILSFLAERGVLRTAAGRVEFDADAVATALPASVQGLVTARVDRLAPRDRSLLQAAAVIGRRFDPQLLSAVPDDAGDIEARLTAMHALDLVNPEGASGDYSFKHALVRDALYQSLLTGARTALHLRIAEEVERRGENRLAEVVETLAHHFSQTDRAEKAFEYLAMAGAKSLGVYSLDEAHKYLALAINLLDKSPDCANDKQVAELIAGYALHSNLLLQFKVTTDTVERFASRLDRLGDCVGRILVQHQYVVALIHSMRYREAEIAQRYLSLTAERLGDTKSRAYALASAVHLSPFVGHHTLDAFETLSREALNFASSLNDSYLKCFLRHALAHDAFVRGRITRAEEVAQELLIVGRQINDPRSTGYGMVLQALAALACADYHTALNLAEAGIKAARTPFDREFLVSARTIALVMLRRPEGAPMLRDFMEKCATNDWRELGAAVDGVWGVSLLTRGEIGKGILWGEKALARREREGYREAIELYRMTLCEIYIEIIAGKEKVPTGVIVRNIVTLIRIMITAGKRIPALIAKVRQNQQIDPNGFHIGRCEMILGLLYKAKKKRPLAVQHLTEAKRIISQFGPSPILTKIETALAEVA